jgi:Gpi18-like mannosyltransferase
MKGVFKGLAIAAVLSLVPTFLIWLPLILRIGTFWGIPLPQNGMATIVANFDGPLYLVAAKTLYNKAQIGTNYQFPLPTEYYTAHFPLFPLLIKFFGLVTNYPYAMLITTVLSSILAIYFFMKLISQYVERKDVLFLTFLFSIFPARWLIVRSVGSADPLFVASVIASLYYFTNKKYWLAGLWGAVAQITKSPGILLFISYLVFLLIPIIKNKIFVPAGKWIENLNLKKTYPILLIPLSLIMVFSFYKIVQGDFWAYFHSGDNIHLIFPPFQIFNYSASWVGTFWLEEIVFIYLLGAIGVYKLFQKKEFELGTFGMVFFFLSLFIAHRDLLRYSLPLVPLLFVAFSDTLIKREFKIGLIVIIVPIYLYSLAFISQNVMPIANWAPFL